MDQIKDPLYRVLIPAILILLAICLIAGAALIIRTLNSSEPSELPPPNNDLEAPPDDTEAPSDRPTGAASVLLGPTADAGQSYIDSMIFVGESTTAHLRHREVLTGGKNTHQVWAHVSNTMMLDLTIEQKTIVYPKTGQSMTIAAAAAIEKPQYMVLSFGVNGIQGFSKNETLYRTAYGLLIDAIHAASPETVVILQTVYPLATNQTTFGPDINQTISRLNEILPEIAAAHDAYLVDTASVLYDANGNLRYDYQVKDGLHLTASAYVAILNYLRTHAYVRPD